MALSLSTTRVFQAWPNTSPTIFTKFNFSTRINLSRLSPPFATNSGRRSFRCRALSPGRPPPPESEPPNGKDSGPAATIARLQETARIFFAVLFWMALFFWYSAWDGRNNDGGTSTRPRKGSWFRR